MVSKQAAPGVFYLPGGKPEPGEDAQATLLRELDEELGVRPHGLTRLADFRGIAALEQAPMLMTVFAATLAGRPGPPPSWPGWPGPPAPTATARCSPRPSATRSSPTSARRAGWPGRADPPRGQP